MPSITTRIRPAISIGIRLLAFSSRALSGIEMDHTMRKGQARYAYNPAPSIAEQLEILTA